MSAKLHAALDAALAALEPDAITLRRHLHAHPELSWGERQTQDALRRFLADRGVATRDCADTGLVAEIGTGPVLALYRGDIDALPITETSDAPYASTRKGVSHACGHDVHATIAATLAVAFHRLGDALPGRVRVVLQPAEEVVPGGAERMIAEGAADGIDAAFAIHVDPAREVGTVGVRSGPITAATDTVTIDVYGESGHSARPHLARDAILAAADIVRSVYTLVSQRVDPMFPAVLNLGTIQGGDAKNVIAGHVRMEGVLRTLDEDVRKTLHAEIRRAVEGGAAALGCEATLTLLRGAPPVRNDPALMAIVEAAAADVLGGDAVHPIAYPSTGAEDFGSFGDTAPQFMLRVGCRTPGAPVHHLHTPRFDVDERCLPIAARIMGRAVLARLQERG